MSDQDQTGLPEGVFFDNAVVQSFVTLPRDTGAPEDIEPEVDLMVLQNDSVFSYLGRDIYDSSPAPGFKIVVDARMLFCVPATLRFDLKVHEMFEAPKTSSLYIQKIGIRGTVWHPQFPKEVTYTLRTFINLSNDSSERWSLFNGSLKREVMTSKINTD